MRKPAAAALIAVLFTAGIAAPAYAAPPTEAPTGVRLIPAGDPVLHVVLWWDAPASDPSIDRFQVFIHPSVRTPVGGMVLTVEMASANAARLGALAAYAQDQNLDDGEQQNYAVRSCNADGCGPWSAVRHHDGSWVGDGHARQVTGDHPTEAVDRIYDYATENAPVVIGVIGAIFAVGTAFWLVRRGLARSRRAMRL